MRLTPRRVAAALAVVAISLTSSGVAHADSSVYCIDVPDVYVGDDTASSHKKLCIPWV